MKEADTIIDEIRAIRDSIAKQHDYDISKIAESIRQEQETCGRTYVRLAPRTPAIIDAEPNDAELQHKLA
ncbi:MAG TPA: hypothetical protein PK156_31825 [Polyangium sp.]|nr:hypothetical protein [Polyangium sp.]